MRNALTLEYQRSRIAQTPSKLKAPSQPAKCKRPRYWSKEPTIVEEVEAVDNFCLVTE